MEKGHPVENDIAHVWDLAARNLSLPSSLRRKRLTRQMHVVFFLCVCVCLLTKCMRVSLLVVLNAKQKVIMPYNTSLGH